MDTVKKSRPFAAKEALDWGLINRIVPPDQLMHETEGLAQTLASGPTRSVAMVKKLLSDTFSQTLETQMELEARGIAEMGKTRDTQDGIQAFIAKRRPNFSGQ